MVLTAGIDIGIQNIKVVLLKDAKVLGRGKTLSGGSGRPQAASRLFQETLQQVGLSQSDLNKVVATGQGKFDASFAESRVVEPVADARAAAWLYPRIQAVIDLGADQARAVQYDSKGKIKQYTLSHKCAAGIGLFLESMAMMLEIPLEEWGLVKAAHGTTVSINDQCAALADLDVVSLIHENVPPSTIVHAINEAMAAKYAAMLNEMLNPIEKEAVLVGGVARNRGVIGAFQKRLGINLVIPEYPEFAGALGAALIAAG